ncbi:alpha/beta hydrolase [Catenuloplanes sp. NPDC051500]|uniref:alpha/beta hydrolase n=1 Tax=Catenuloplanes sp. NPDC051500 TaxID=3363959 RepID=UPI0037990520
MRNETITFDADGVQLTGVLRVPDDADGRAVALTGPFTGVKEQVTGTYADRLARQGIITLAFDHRGFGESGGRRQHEDSAGKLADLRAAVTTLQEHADRIGLVGICLGGGYAVRAAASDPRVRAVAGIAGAYNSPAWFAAQSGLANYRNALTSFIETMDEMIPAVAPDNGEAAMGGDEPFAYYGTARSAAPNWRNEMTRGSLHALMTLDALGAAPLLAETPLLVVHGTNDDYCSPELARRMQAETPGESEIRWLEADLHIDLYDSEPHVAAASDATAAFLHKHL